MPTRVRPSRSAPEASLAEVAVRLLARREHSRRELRIKLEARGFDPTAILPALDELERQGLLSEARFVESYVRSRCEKGFGPLRIAAELRERGVSDTLIDRHLDPGDPRWLSRARAAHARRYPGGATGDRKERARRVRFLAGRGFSTTLALAAVEEDPEA